MIGREEEEAQGPAAAADGPVAEPAAAAEVGPALKPRERSSGTAARIADEVEVAQSAKAPESEGRCLLVVATTADVIIVFLDQIPNFG